MITFTEQLKIMKAILFLTLILVLNNQSIFAQIGESMFYDIKINALSGEPIDLNVFKGKKILIVNVASKCGFTPQYKDLQTLFEKYGDQLMIIGVPCNQFGAQEPGTNEEIATFCEKNYGVSFLITEKLDVKGKDQHPLYQWLTQKDLNGVADSEVKWNFHKYLINEEGELIESYGSRVNPLSEEITKHLK